MHKGLEKLYGAFEEGLPVYYVASAEQSLLFEAAAAGRRALLPEGDEATVIGGPLPDLDAAFAAAGSISFFSGRRLIELREITPSAMGDKDVSELAELFDSLENAVLLVTALYKDKKAAGAKKAKTLFTAAQKAGFATELAKPTRGENLAYLRESAGALGTAFGPGADAALLERAGEDRWLLLRETEKLAAMCGYTTIDTALVERQGVHTVEADAFALLRLVTAGNKALAQAKLADLFALRYEPIAISSALAGGFIDMVRVRLGKERGFTHSQVFKDFGYTGNDWRLKKAGENAVGYSTQNLQRAVFCLEKLDIALKSAALSDKRALLQAAVAELTLLGRAR